MTQLQETTLASVIEPLPATASPRDTLSTALGKMRKKGAHELPVIDSKGRLEGILSQEALLRRRRVPLTTTVDRLSVRPPRLTPSDSVVRAAKALLENNFQELPVVDDRTGKAVGQVTQWKLLKLLRGDPSVASMDASSVMSPDPVVVAQDETADRALVEMSKLNETTVPVVDGSGGLVGVVSASDILRSYAGTATPTNTMRKSRRRREGYHTTVEGFMTSPPLSAGRGTKVGALIDDMVELGASSVVIVEGERPVGIVTKGDLLGMMASLEPEEGCFMQITGMEGHDPFLTDELWSVIDPTVKRIAAHARPLTLHVHVMEHHRSNGHRVECRVRMNTDNGLYVATSEDDNILRAVAEVMDRLEKIVGRDVDRTRPSPNKARSGVTKAGHAKVV